MIPGLDPDKLLPASTREELDLLLYQVKNEGMDLMIVIDGKEGVGKTGTEKKLACYCGLKLGTYVGVPNIHYSTDEYMKSSDTMGRYTVHCLDEAGVILHRASSNTRQARRFTKYLQVAREGNNQVHIITLPAYHILDGYLVNWRCKFVMHMFGETVKDDKAPTGKRIKRGAFVIYPASQQLTEMWNLYQDRKVFVYPKQWFIRDRVPDIEVFTPEETEALFAKKKKWRADFIDDDGKTKEQEVKVTRALEKQVKILGAFHEGTGKEITVDLVQNLFFMSASGAYKVCQEYKRLNEVQK
jgi:hypothetical protein